MRKGTKITSVVTGVILAVMLTGCGAKNVEQNISTEQEKDTASKVSAESQETVEEDVAATPDRIRENGQFANVEDLTEEELHYHMGVFLKAIQELDVETLRDYTDNNEMIYRFKLLGEDPAKVAFWNKVVDEMVYFEDSTLLVAKCPSYIYTKWFTEKAESGSKFPGSVGEISPEEADEIYNQYFASAPYMGGLLRDTLKADVQDGYLKFNMETVFDCLGFGLDSLFDTFSDELCCGALLFGVDEHFEYDEDTMTWLEQEIPEYRSVMSMNLAEIVSIVEAGLPEEEKAGIAWKFYQEYYVPQESRAILQEYFDQNVECYRYDLGLGFFTKASMELDYPWNCATEEDRAWLENKNLVNPSFIWEFLTDFETGFEPFCIVAQNLIKAGELQ